MSPIEVINHLKPDLPITTLSEYLQVFPINRVILNVKVIPKKIAQTLD